MGAYIPNSGMARMPYIPDAGVARMPYIPVGPCDCCVETVNCNDCAIELLRYYSITFEDLTGVFADFNGTHVVDALFFGPDTCVWATEIGDWELILYHDTNYWYSTTGWWFVFLSNGINSIRFAKCENTGCYPLADMLSSPILGKANQYYLAVNDQPVVDAVEKCSVTSSISNPLILTPLTTTPLHMFYNVTLSGFLGEPRYIVDGTYLLELSSCGTLTWYYARFGTGGTNEFQMSLEHLDDAWWLTVDATYLPGGYGDGSFFYFVKDDPAIGRPVGTIPFYDCGQGIDSTQCEDSTNPQCVISIA